MYCQYDVQHLCSNYQDHNNKIYHDVDEWKHATSMDTTKRQADVTSDGNGGSYDRTGRHNVVDASQSVLHQGLGLGDADGTVTSTDTHGLGAIGHCTAADSVRVYHANAVTSMGHHCKLIGGAAAGGACTCRCNQLFKGAYNPKATDLFDKTIELPLDAPTLQPTSWPTMYPTPSPTDYPTMAAPSANDLVYSTSSASAQVDVLL